MTDVDRSALVLHSARQMFDLVNDVLDYPSFLPWCASAEIVEQTPEQMVARLGVSKGGFKYSFVTRNCIEAPESIVIELVEGPFSSLAGSWHFTPLSEEACKVSLNLSFGFKGKLTGLAMGKVFNQIAVAMMGAFCEEADKRYGS
ncbi:MAG: ribosome-associated toxin RatA of RatAB toxin-antitoxin module [Motiliproteus sp.]|jgi:ribosome-associated toxin RatA of RatAB toxin-antitoxin module